MEVGRSPLTELGRAGRAEQLSHRFRSEKSWMESDLLLAIREVDEVTRLKQGFCRMRGLCKWWGSIVAEKTPAHLAPKMN